MKKNSYLRKYFIMGSQNCHRDPVKILREALEAGITAFQFREKGSGSLSGNEKIQLGKRLRRLCAKYDVPFFINDDVHLISLLDVDGIHVGQDDQSVEGIMEQFPNVLIGLSISNEFELAKSPIHLVDYIGAGPIFSTSTKEDAKQAVGVEWIAELRSRFPKLPIVGIGGINASNADKVIASGADGVAVISALTNAKHIAHTVSLL